MDLYPDFKNFLQWANGGLKDFTHKGKCSGCGSCCSNLLPLSDTEIEIIRTFVAEHDIHDTSTQDCSCPFLTRNNRCSIYSIRPIICKIFKCNRKTPSRKHYLLLCKDKRHLIDVRYTFFTKSSDISNEI